jgi:hypothetical protein
VASCKAEVPGVDTMTMTLRMEPCKKLATMDLDLNETKQGFHRHFGGVADVNETVQLKRLHVEVPRIGNATAVAHVELTAGNAQVEAKLSMDVCGTMLGREGCASEVPFSPFPVHALDLKHDFGDFCNASHAVTI